VKYVLVDKGDNIVSRVELDSDVGVSGAKTYFRKKKDLDIKEFENIWKVMTESNYERQRDLSNRQNKQFEWWKEEESYLDIDKYE
tara:strand:+ start:1566 stop:1820 length:255 start_codon:yes stop_codon:yes gene_type:complete